MASANLLTPEALRNLVEYDSETGLFRFRNAWPDLFDDSGRLSRESRCSKWNRRNGGKPAFTTMNADGYLVCGVIGVKLYAHRVAWAIVHGEWAREIDHINGDRADNRLINLRSVTRQQNARNSAAPVSCGADDVCGVRYRPKYGTWRAYIGIAGKMIHLGTFKDRGEAISARRAASLKYGFTDRHGT